VSANHKLRVALIAGGRSSEHEISLASARSVLESLDPERYDVVSLAIGRDGRWELGRGRERQALGSDPGTGPAETLPVPAAGGTMATLGEVDVALPILHGPFGEDGTVQGLLELAGVPYVGPGVLASALCMDKDVFKSVMRDNGVPVTRHRTLRLGDPVENPFGYPVFVKPARLGSSVGISKVRAEAELDTAVELARRHDEKVLVEEFVPGTEIEVGVLGNLPTPQASLPGQVVSHLADWYDWASKYDEGGSELLIPPPGLSDEQAERAQRLAITAFVATECEGMARADFFVRESDGEIVMNELNTIPGFTATSFYARLFAASGITYEELLRRLIDLALERHERRRGLQF
jgi:D-alanine-D-alanine ligase